MFSANPFIPRIRFRILSLSLSFYSGVSCTRPVISTSINVGENSSLSLLHTVSRFPPSLFFFFVAFSSRKDSAGDGDRAIEEAGRK